MRALIPQIRTIKTFKLVKFYKNRWGRIWRCPASCDIYSEVKQWTSLVTWQLVYDQGPTWQYKSNVEWIGWGGRRILWDRCRKTTAWFSYRLWGIVSRNQTADRRPTYCHPVPHYTSPQFTVDVDTGPGPKTSVHKAWATPVYWSDVALNGASPYTRCQPFFVTWNDRMECLLRTRTIRQ